MSTHSPQQHPFYSNTYGAHHCYYTTADDRIARVKSFTKQQCLAALQLDGLQKTVVQAIHRRLNVLAAGGEQ